MFIYSTVSAVINALAAVFLNDYIFPAIKSVCHHIGKPEEKVLTETIKRNIAVALGLYKYITLDY